MASTMQSMIRISAAHCVADQPPFWPSGPDMTDEELAGGASRDVNLPNGTANATVLDHGTDSGGWWVKLGLVYGPPDAGTVAAMDERFTNARASSPSVVPVPSTDSLDKMRAFFTGD